MTDENYIPQIKPDQAESGKKTIAGRDDLVAKPKTTLSIPKFLKNGNENHGEQNPATFENNTKKNYSSLTRLSAIWGKRKIKLFVLLAILFILVNIILFLNVFFKVKSVISSAKKLETAVAGQDLTKVKEELTGVETSLKKLRGSYTLISWLKFTPFAGVYVRDGQHLINAGLYGVNVTHLLIGTVEPYSDLLGFTGSQDTSDKTAEDRIDFIVKTLPSLTPKLGEISTAIELVKKETDQIDPMRYPGKLGGKTIRSKVEKVITLVDQSSSLITDGRPLIEQAPYLLGIESPRTYLVLFQNDKELRPTGGFLTAYSIMKVDKGKFEPVSSDDIYNLDAKYKPNIPAPQPLIAYIKGPYILSKNLRLRDINWSPDFYQSMKVFTDEAQSVGVTDIDGVIAVDTQLLVNLLDVLGSVGVPGFGNFSNEIIKECNCPQVIYELESFADTEGPIVWDPNTGEIVYTPPNFDNRKKIIGPLMNSVLANAMGQQKEKLPDLFSAAYKSLTEKHVLIFLFNKDVQAAVEGFNIAGRINDVNGDYLHINDANLGGRKSNLYVTQEVSQEYKLDSDGTIEKTVVITYNNPEKYDGWLNSVLPNWVRVYVPKGSKLIAFEGVEDKKDSYEELGKTVFAGFFQLRPQGVAKVTVKYKLPFNARDLKNGLKLLVQKQPGKDTPMYHIKYDKQEEELFLKSDKEFKINI